MPIVTPWVFPALYLLGAAVMWQQRYLQQTANLLAILTPQEGGE